jgi:peptide/nickel transport system permease protein
MSDILIDSSDNTERKTASTAHRILRQVSHDPLAAIGLSLLLLILLTALLAPLIAPADPLKMNVIERLKPPSMGHFFGTDQYGRDIFSRVLYGGRISLLIAVTVAAGSMFVGFLIGAIAGLFRWADIVLMRIMDALMAIPGILLAIALMSVSRASVTVVIVAITIPEIPRVARLVRSVVLTIREQTYMHAAATIGVRLPRLILRYLLPNTLAALIVQATYVCASAVLLESYLSFLGVGTPPETPSWGNIIAEGRLFVQIAPWQIIFPGTLLAIVVLSINVVGDGLRDALDPKLSRRL